VIEHSSSRVPNRIHHDELVARSRLVAIPEPVAVNEPLGIHLVAEHQLGGMPGQQDFRLGVVDLLPECRHAEEDGTDWKAGQSTVTAHG
jgi:hypothetical protein